MLHLASGWEAALTILFLLVAFGVIASKLTERPRIPDVAVFLIIGILVGPQVLNWVTAPGVSQVNQFILYLGATLILFDGGRAVRFAVLKRVYITISLLVTTGILIAAVLVGIAVHDLFGASWLWSLLLAAIMASTDPATLIPVFKRVPIVARLQQTMETESAFNDATASVLVATLMTAITTGHQLAVGPAVLEFFHSSLIGLAVGVALGLVALWTVSKEGWGVFHEFASVILFVVAIGSYVVANQLGASGFMAAFAAGVITGNGRALKLPFVDKTNENIEHFGSVMTTIMRILIFILLGTQVDFKVVFANLGNGLLIVAVLMFVARPATILGSVLVDRVAKWRLREIVFMMWVRETGVIPAALAGAAVAAHVPHSDIIMAVTFLAILCTILAQATTTGIVAKLLGLNRPAEEEEL